MSTLCCVGGQCQGNLSPANKKERTGRFHSSANHSFANPTPVKSTLSVQRQPLFYASTLK
jgi:hypothetical protein